MIASILLITYAAASVALAFWIRRAVKLRLDWAHPRMRAPVFSGTVRSTGGEGALGAADAVSTAVLSSASPNAVMVFVIVVAGLIGGVIGAGVLPALVGGIGQPGWPGMMALAVVTLAWAWIGGSLALPVLALAFSLAPVLAGLVVIGFIGMMLGQTFGSGHPGLFSSTSTWQAGFGARLDYNLCAAGTSLITLGNPQEIERRCKQKVVGAHPVEGRFAGVYSCQPGQRVAAIVDVRPYGPFRDGLKTAEFSFGDRPAEAMFPNGMFAGVIRPSGAGSEFRSDELKWIQNPTAGWGKPDQLSIKLASGGISVMLMNTPCTEIQAKRCEPAEPGRVPTCEREFANLGIKLYKPGTLKELSRTIAEQEARQARTR